MKSVISRLVGVVLGLLVSIGILPPGTEEILAEPVAELIGALIVLVSVVGPVLRDRTKESP